MSWDAVGGNPVPGDPQVARRIAAVFGIIGDEAEILTSRLHAIDGGTGPQIWRGEAANTFRDLLPKLGPDLAKLTTSHHNARQALVTYAGHLEDAQSTARRASADAGTAVSDRARATHRQEQAAAEAASQEWVFRAATIRIGEAHLKQQTVGTLDPAYAASLQHY
ncbi:MAG: hypothetical protein L0K86_16020, partial [Actinomycetia bacterium]|nr:hypothetical protein [Actinomycetes bacterium]